MEDMPDIEQIGKIINAVKTAKMLGEVMQGNKEEPCTSPPVQEEMIADNLSVADEHISEFDKEVTLCAFDRELQSPAIRSIKAAIPYLDYKYQRNMGIVVKIMEMDRLINHYTVLAAENGKDKSRQMLMAVKNELPEKNRSAADLLMKLMEIMDIVNINMQNA